MRSAEFQSFVHSFMQYYPCEPCAKHMQGWMKDNPVRVSSRRDLARWTCEAHNAVNELQHKELFDCSRVDERWRERDDC